MLPDKKGNFANPSISFSAKHCDSGCLLRFLIPAPPVVALQHTLSVSWQQRRIQPHQHNLKRISDPGSGRTTELPTRKQTGPWTQWSIPSRQGRKSSPVTWRPNRSPYPPPLPPVHHQTHRADQRVTLQSAASPSPSPSLVASPVVSQPSEEGLAPRSLHLVPAQQ